ncbi:PH domain-containing protein [Candidatus Saccharibacteria bacterium]|nr:PH domain-containing protein [Candidatus Saccharibacteria bacterium]
MDKSLNKIRHERSKRDFPGLKLEDDEFVEFAFSRSKICLLLILGCTSLGLIVVLFVFLLILMKQDMLDAMGRNFLFILLTALLVAAVIIGAISYSIYRGNKLFITNRHAIQFVMTSPFSTSVNIIELSKVEDASFKQEGIIQNMFRYGTFRLATVGDETTYTFKYVSVTPETLKAVSKLISSYKDN